MMRAPADAVGRSWRPTVRYIRDIAYVAPTESVLDLESADRSRQTVTVQSAADPRAAASEVPDDHVPMAVRLHAGHPAFPWTCSCLCATAAGPRYISVSVAAGLALIASGRHGVVVNERPDPSANTPERSSPA
jgi:hypothetical protein